MSGLSVEGHEHRKDFFDKRAKVFESHAAEEIFFLKTATEYAQLGIRTFLLLGGGALFAIPAYLSSADAVNIDTIRYVFAGAGFIAGSLFVGALSILVIWVNFNALGMHKASVIRRDLDVAGLIAFQDDIALNQDFQKSISESETAQGNYLRRIGWTYWAGLLLPVLMVILFLLGMSLCGYGFYISVSI